MKAKFKLSSIKTKIALMVALPVLLCLILVQDDVHRNYTEYNVMKRTIKITKAIPVMSAMVHQLQKERGYSAGYIGSGGTLFQEELAQQQKACNQTVTQSKDFVNSIDMDAYPEPFLDLITNIMNDLERLQETRSKILSVELSVPQSHEYYTSIIRKCLDLDALIENYSHRTELSNRISAKLMFSQAKERGGAIRSILSTTFANDGFESTQTYARFIGLVNVQEQYIERFKQKASPEQIDLFQSKIADPKIKTAARLQALAFDQAMTGQFGVDAGEWFDAQTARINSYKEVEDRLLADLDATEEHLLSRDRRNLGFSLLVCLICVVMLVTCFSFGSAMVRRILRAHEFSQQIAHGDFSGIIQDPHRDEIADLIDGLNHMAQSLMVMLKNLEENSGVLKAQSARLFQTEKHMRGLSEGVDEKNTLAATAMEQIVGKGGQGQVGKITASTEEIGEDIVEIKNAAAEINDDMARCSQATRDLSATLGEVTEAMHQLMGSMSTVSANTDEGITASSNAREQAARAMAIITTLNDSADSIEEVLNIIGMIASRTNLLALNATIEAARAGELGKGFAVVATEVKELAGESHGALERINEQIKAMKKATADTIKTIRATVDCIGDVSRITGTISEAVGHQNTLAKQVDQHLNNAVNSAREVDRKVEFTSENVVKVDQLLGHSRERVDAVVNQARELAVCAEHVEDALHLSQEAGKKSLKGIQENHKAAENLSDLVSGMTQIIANFKTGSTQDIS